MPRAQKTTHAVTSPNEVRAAMTQDVQDALVILCAAYGRANIDQTYSIEEVNKVRTILQHAMHHLTSPTGKPARKVR